MQLKSIRLIVVELTQSLRVFTDTSREYGEWEVEPTFTIGFNKEKQLIQNVEVLVTRSMGTQHAQIKVMTSFELEVGSPDYIPTTDQDFLEYASIQQISIAHARTFFIRETKGTRFENNLIPIDNFQRAFSKVKLAVFTTKNSN